MSVKTALLMINLGGPKTPELVQPFLVRMFSDKTFIPIPFNLGPTIAKFRARKSVRNQYQAIGGSPLQKWTNIQGSLLIDILNQKSPSSAPHKFYPCFRYCSPDSQQVAQQLIQDQPQKIVAFTQYPHYSCATTGNSLRQLLKYLPQIPCSAISSWATHPTYIKSWVQLIKNELDQFQKPSEAVIVFTAHSIPANVMWRGDRYPLEIAATMSRIMDSFSNEYHLFWQSKVGFQQWLQPDTESGLKKLAKGSKKEVVLVPIAFTQDHLETLFELDLEYVEMATQAGLNVRRCQAPNDNPLFIKALSEIVMEHLEDKKHSYIPRCINCRLPDECPKIQKFRSF